MKQLSDLAFFSELVRHESLASAAMAFDVTPPAVSRRLAALEKRLGVRLLATGNLLWVAASAWVVWGSGLALTPWGEAWVLVQAVFVLLLAGLAGMGLLKAVM